MRSTLGNQGHFARPAAAGLALALLVGLAACSSGATRSAGSTTSGSGSSRVATTAAAAGTTALPGAKSGTVAADAPTGTYAPSVAPATTAAPSAAAAPATAAATTAAAATGSASGGAVAATGSASASTTGGASAATTAAPRMSSTDEAVPPVDRTRPTPAPQNQNPLRAGNTDDNANFGDYLAYRARAKQLGTPYRELDPTDRTVVRVVGSDALPAAGRKVVIRQGRSEVVTLTTTADGTVRFHPHAYQSDQQSPFIATVDQTEITLQPGQTQRLTLPNPAANQNRVKVDVLFLLDATGSMGDEIDQLKSNIRSVADRLSNLAANPDVRLGLTSYRDLGDAYLTRTTDFTNDVSSFQAALNKVTADGGGDIPEAVDEALVTALSEPSWRSDAISLIFLVADAGPHIDRQVQTPYTKSMRTAAARGIKIFPVASSNTDDAAEFVFRQLAQFTGARFVFLSYGAAGAALGADTDIQKSDYQELALNDLIVRLVAEEVASRTGR